MMEVNTSTFLIQPMRDTLIRVTIAKIVTCSWFVSSMSLQKKVRKSLTQLSR